MVHSDRGLAWTGIAFTVLFVVGGLMLGDLFGAFADPDSFFLDYFADQSHHARDLAGGHLLAAAALSLLLFLHLLIRRLGTLGGNEIGLQIAQSSGVIAVALLLTGTAATVTVTMASGFGRMTGDEPFTSASVALAPQIGYVLIFFPTMWAMALTIGLISWSVWRIHVWSTWGCWLSAAAAFLVVTSWIAFTPIVVLPIWVLGVSFWAWRSPRLMASPVR